MKTLLWELRSDSGILARCFHEHDASAGNVVTVTVGGVEPFREHYRTEADAHEEAAHLLAHYLANGWTDVTYCDPRIALP